MKRALKLLWAAFAARPFGMPIPPNWFGLAAFGLLGHLLHSGFYLIGLGLELAYLGLLLASDRFRTAAAGPDGGEPPAWVARRNELLAALDDAGRKRQLQLEADCAGVAEGLRRLASGGDQIDGLAQLCWLHLRLLAARDGVRAVVASGEREAAALAQREGELERRLADGALGLELRTTLEEQRDVIRRRRAAHGEARSRQELIDAELERIRQQAALMREQTLLASDPEGLSQSVNELAASLDEAGRWLRESQELLGSVDALGEERPDGALFAGRAVGRRRAGWRTEAR